MSELTRNEYETMVKRMEDEDHRQNKRLDMLEESLKKLNDLTVTVGKMAVSLETMTKQLERQATQLADIEKAPARRWNQVVSALIGAVVAAAVAYFLH